jgi:hypothetical protein
MASNTAAGRSRRAAAGLLLPPDGPPFGGLRGKAGKIGLVREGRRQQLGRDTDVAQDRYLDGRETTQRHGSKSTCTATGQHPGRPRGAPLA